MRVDYDNGYLSLAWRENEDFKFETDSFKQTTINIAGKERHFRVDRFVVSSNDSIYMRYAKSYEVNLIEIAKLQTKSEEEIAAEESVKKAEEALKAAKDVLGKINSK